jgi:hypothetical protein
MHSVFRQQVVLVALSMVLLPAAARAQVCVAAPAGLVGWWPGDGDPIDAVAGNNGVLLGDATFLPGIVGQGFKLDGAGDGVQIPDALALKPATVSVEAWVRFDSLDTPIVSQFGAPGQQFIVFKKNTRTFNFEGYSLHKQRQVGGDRLAFRVASATGSGNIAVSSTPVVVGQFYHVVGTYDGAQVRLYVNGVLEGQAAAAITLDYDTRPVFIGTSGETVFDGKLNGVVDEASIYNRALTAAEVSDLHLAGSAGKCRSASGMLSQLVSFVQTLNLSRGISNSFDAKLRTAIEALDDASAGDASSACGKMGAFLNEVNAQEGVTLSSAQVQQLRTIAGQIRNALGCR